MQFLSTLLNILIFLLCLSFVVCIHELGHLLMAKIFHVYCFEYSIGFGPALFKHKFKHKVRLNKGKKGEKPLYKADQDGKPVKVEGETQLAIRALPLGGYVAMAGDDESNETPDGKIVPPERTLNGVNHAKQIGIMLAGITMNFILAFVLFFCEFAFCTQKRVLLNSNAVTVSEKLDDKNQSPAYLAGLRSGDQILTLYQEYDGLTRYEDGVSTTVDDVFFPYNPETETDLSKWEITNYEEYRQTEEKLTYNDLLPSSLEYHVLDIFTASSQGLLTLPAEYDHLMASAASTRTLHIEYLDANGEKHSVVTSPIPTTEVKNQDNTISYSFGLLGISPDYENFRYGVKQGFVLAGKSFGQLFVGIYSAIGTLFTPSGWQNAGGIIAVYRMSATGVQYGLAYFIYLWGYISLNLGCFNLLPIPGLDGWQTLIALIETCTRKKLPKKFKNIANTVGLIVLFVLAGLLVVKDIIIK